MIECGGLTFVVFTIYWMYAGHDNALRSFASCTYKQIDVSIAFALVPWRKDYEGFISRTI